MLAYLEESFFGIPLLGGLNLYPAPLYVMSHDVVCPASYVLFPSFLVTVALFLRMVSSIGQ